jgi:hypothetical protein
MRLCHDQRHVVEDGAICARLFRKAGQSVPVALQLESVERAIDDREIDARGPVQHAQFLNDDRLIVTSVLGEKLPLQGGADVGIAH